MVCAFLLNYDSTVTQVGVYRNIWICNLIDWGTITIDQGTTTILIGNAHFTQQLLATFFFFSCYFVRKITDCRSDNGSITHERCTVGNLGVHFTPYHHTLFCPQKIRVLWVRIGIERSLFHYIGVYFAKKVNSALHSYPPDFLRII